MSTRMHDFMWRAVPGAALALAVVAFTPQQHYTPAGGVELTLVSTTGTAATDRSMGRGKTNHLGTYHFKNVAPGKYKIVGTLPPSMLAWAKKMSSGKAQDPIKIVIDASVKSPISFGSKTGKNPLLFETPEFVIESKVTLMKTVVSVNNYGINDDGIK